jgi:hypothetical protein
VDHLYSVVISFTWNRRHQAGGERCTIGDSRSLAPDRSDLPEKAII